MIQDIILIRMVVRIVNKKPPFWRIFYSPMVFAEFNAWRNACSAIWRIFGANVRMFMVSATVFPNRRDIYSIWVGEIM